MTTPLTTTPVFAEIWVRGPGQLVRGGAAFRDVVDLRTSYGAVVFVVIGRGGTTALGTAISVLVNRLIALVATGSGFPPYDTGGPFAIKHPAPVTGGSLTSQTAAAAATTVNDDSIAGSTLLGVASSAGFAAGDLITINGGGDYTRWEIGRVIKVSTGVLRLDAPLQFTHTAAQADLVANKAEAFAIPVDGGSNIEIIVDYGAAATGDDADVAVFLQQYSSDSTQ